MPDRPALTAAGVRVVDHAVLRVAAWPIEISDVFAAPALADAARAVLVDRSILADADQDPIVAASIDALAEAIHAAVPNIDDQATRRWLLAVRRALRRPSDVVPAAPPTAMLDAVAHHPGGPALIEAIEAVRGPRAEAAGRRASLTVAFDDELRRARAELRSFGASPRFRSALAIAEPSVLVRWEATREKPLSDKARVRRLEATVLHFAMRACGRPTPNGGWAGVAKVLPSDGSDPAERTDAAITVGTATRRAQVSVDLAPFVAVLASWSRALGSARDHPLRREPTLRDDPPLDSLDGLDRPGADADHRWVYLARGSDPSAFAALATVPELRDALRRWPPSTVATPAALYDDLGEERGRAIVDHLLACGVLHSALQLPAFADSPAAALDEITPVLPEPYATTWREAILATSAASHALADAFLADDVALVVRQRDAIHAVVSALTNAAGLGDGPDRGLVHLDLGVPWRSAWTASGRAAVAAALEDVLAFHAADGSAEAYRSVMVDRVGAALAAGSGGPSSAVDHNGLLRGVAANRSKLGRAPAAVTTRAELLRSVGVDPAPAEARWAAQLEESAGAGRSVHELAVETEVHPAAGAAGSFVVGVGASAIWARWGRPQPGMFVTRFAPLLRGSDGDADDQRAGDPVLTSLARTLRRIGAHRIVGSDADNPNAALRPMLDGVPSWGWTLTSDVGDPTAEQVLDLAGDPIVLGPHGDPFVPVYDSAAVIGSHDPVSRFVRTVAMAHGWELTAWGFPVLEAEIERWRSLPRLVIGSPRRRRQPVTVLAPRRWVLGGPALDAIRAETDEVERFLAWRAAMDQRDIPSRVIARWALRPDAPELILVTESPLAVRCLLERLPEGPATLVLSELPEPIDEWPVTGPEGHHLSELAVTWVRRSPPLDPEVFPGGLVPGSFGAILDLLDDAEPAADRRVDSDHHHDEVQDEDQDDEIGRRCRARFAALLDELVEPAERTSIALASASWLSRVADAQDPAGAGRDDAVDDEPASARDDSVGPERASDRRLRTDLRSLRPAFDQDIDAIAALGNSPDTFAVRAQLVARLAHIDTVARWGEGPDRLRREASVWRRLGTT